MMFATAKHVFKECRNILTKSGFAFCCPYLLVNKGDIASTKVTECLFKCIQIHPEIAEIKFEFRCTAPQAAANFNTRIQKYKNLTNEGGLYHS